MSSFACPRHLPADYLNIDDATVAAINLRGRPTRIHTIAAFVKHDRILDALRAIVADSAQGRGVGAAMPLIFMMDAGRFCH